MSYCLNALVTLCRFLGDIFNFWKLPALVILSTTRLPTLISIFHSIAINQRYDEKGSTYYMKKLQMVKQRKLPKNIAKRTF